MQAAVLSEQSSLATIEPRGVFAERSHRGFRNLGCLLTRPRLQVGPRKQRRALILGYGAFGHTGHYVRSVRSPPLLVAHTQRHPDDVCSVSCRSYASETNAQLLHLGTSLLQVALCTPSQPQHNGRKAHLICPFAS